MKTGIANLDGIYNREALLMAQDDSLVLVLGGPLAAMDKLKMQDLVLSCYTIAEFHPTTGGMSAIKNELHLKQFSGSRLISYIADYEQALNTMQKGQDLQYQNIRDYLQGFFSQHLTAANLDGRAFQFKQPLDSQLLNVTSADLAKLATQVEIIKITNMYLKLFNRTLKEKAEKLTIFIKGEYQTEK
ncbi:MAG TPA: hypothetical protein VKR32_09565 [Puia sp.]|nr:hypothetical protein [Puia sp.]